MCGRYTLTTTGEALQQELDLELVPEALQPRYNVAPTQPVPVVTNRAPSRVELFRWGLIPSWAGDRSIGNRMINARAESLAQKPSFRNALQRRRCLVLADGYYEWKRTSAGKQPMYVRLASRRPFVFAGLWEVWRAPDGERVLSCTIVTCPAEGKVAEIHHRMPVIVPPGARGSWLARASPSREVLAAALKHTPVDALEVYPVSKVVNSPANDGPECIAPLKS